MKKGEVFCSLIVVSIFLISFVSAAVDGDVLFAYRYGGTSMDKGLAIATDASGNTYITGFFQGTVNFEGTPLTSAGGIDIFVAKYSPTGVHLWSRQFGGAGTNVANGIKIDVNGDVFVTGQFTGTMNLGGSDLTSLGLSDIFVAKLSGANGAYIWSKSFGNSLGDDVGYALATTSNGDVVVTGLYYKSVDFGGGALTSIFDGQRSFVVRLAGSNGAHVWSKSFWNTATDIGYGVAVDSSDNVFVTGYFYGRINFGGTEFTSFGYTDTFLVKLSGVNGAHLWSKQLGGTLDEIAYGIATDSLGDVIITGRFAGSSNFGGTPLTSVGLTDIFMAKYAGSNGGHVWSKRAGANDYDQGQSVATDSSNNVIFTGSFKNSVSFGGTPLTNRGSEDIYVVKYDASGTHIWSKGYGGTGSDVGLGVATDSNGNAFLTGYFTGTTNVDGIPLTSAGSGDVLLVKIQGAGGTPACSKHPADTNMDNNIVLSEYIVYAVCYLTSGCSLDFYNNAATLYFSGEVYHCNQGVSCPPNLASSCWSPGAS